MTINELLTNRVFEIFYEISQIPHGSYHEAAISDWLVQWAKERDFTGEVVERLVTMLGGTIKMHSAYPCWEYRPSSELRKIAEKIFTERNGSAPKSYAVHAGLECGCFFETRPDLDAISVGPNCVGLHSPEERLSISSTKKMYGMLKQLVREVCLEEK